MRDRGLVDGHQCKSTCVAKQATEIYPVAEFVARLHVPGEAHGPEHCVAYVDYAPQQAESVACTGSRHEWTPASLTGIVRRGG